ncbi:hypothetical protein [Sinorhizobium medicae]
MRRQLPHCLLGEQVGDRFHDTACACPLCIFLETAKKISLRHAREPRHTVAVGAHAIAFMAAHADVEGTPVRRFLTRIALTARKTCELAVIASRGRQAREKRGKGPNLIVA